jgi:mannose/cellobiose epimerase-like protein (N-acyl-D-glucosamine 2-epimerase family)
MFAQTFEEPHPCLFNCIERESRFPQRSEFRIVVMARQILHFAHASNLGGATYQIDLEGAVLI